VSVRLSILLSTTLLACVPACVKPEPTLLALEGPVERIAFGSCAFQWEEQPIFRAIVAADPDLYLSLGDAIYGDYDGERTFDVSPDSLRAEWARLAASPDWQALRARVPVMATWDNHDYGHHSAGAEFPLKEESKGIFLDFFGEPADSERRRRAGIYDAAILGPEGRRVQVILLDTRTFKSPPRLAERPEGAAGSLGKYAPDDDPGATLLGEEQWAWLADQLRQPAEVRLVCSSGQVVADQKGMDEWGNYPRERSRLFELIEATGAEGVLLLSGNVHFAEVSRTAEGPYPLLDFTSSGLTHVDEEYAWAPNRFRIAGPFAQPHFGLVEIDWKARPSPRLTLRALDVSGDVAFEHGLELSGLRP
jgi:alkaline phosphatase D